MTRVYKITGEAWTGTEVGRNGNMITLRGSQKHWPFPQERTLARSALTYMHGAPEPDTEPGREGPEPVQFEDRTASLFSDNTTKGTSA